MSSNKLPPPTAFGAPIKFSSWRPFQEEAVQSVVNSKHRFIVQVQPTGSGKSLCYIMAAVLSNKRALILTSTRALQDQIMADFGACFKIADVRGQSNYTCLHQEPLTCEEGLCHIGYECALKSSGCLYYDAVRRAARSQMVVTNYAFWLTSARIGDTIGKFDLLVLDESHDAPEWVIKAISAEISKKIVDIGCQIPEGTDANVWRMWAGQTLGLVQDKIKENERRGTAVLKIGESEQAFKLRQYERVLSNVTQMDPGNMVVDIDSIEVTIEPISASGLSEKLLFRDVKQILLTSATIRPKTISMLGVDGDMQFNEYQSRFPVERRKVIYVPTVRMRYDMDQASIRRWVAQIDNVIRQRKDRKGIIHTVSYERAKTIINLSEHRDMMIGHDRRGLFHAIKAYKRSSIPKILVSPSVVTGFDFPYQECEFQIISKVGFPDSRSAAMKARVDRDPEYAHYITMQSIVQSAGRGMRSEDDQCETIILDDNWAWFIGRWGKFAPRWFKEACSTSRTIPRPPERLRR